MHHFHRFLLNLVLKLYISLKLVSVVDEFAPLFHVRADAPPFLLITGDREQELLGRYEENAYLMRMLRVSGHEQVRLYELEGYGHRMVEPAIPLVLAEIKRVKSAKGF